MRILSVNCGSSTLKFDVRDVGPRYSEKLAHGIVDRIGRESTASLSANGEMWRSDERAPDHSAAFDIAVGLLSGAGLAEGLHATGHRVVHGGAQLSDPVIVDASILEAIARASELAPLHNGPALAALGAARSRLGNRLPMVATFDTAFYTALPDVAAVYALPRQLSERFSIRRYGFHGLAHRYMVERFRVLRPDVAQPRLITLQLGNGCSATASLDGRAIDTSMGFTPLEGLIMGTRSGDLDPSLPLILAEKAGMTAQEVEWMLNHESGLLGLSGRSNDMRDILDAAKDGDVASDLAVRAFCYRARKYVGTYLAVLGGADAIVFGGGIGEHVPEVRARICDGLEWTGVTLDAEVNAVVIGVEASIGARDSTIGVYVVPVDEGSVIARDTHRCLARRMRQVES